MKHTRFLLAVFLSFLFGASSVVADEIFFWFGQLRLDYYYWPSPFGIFGSGKVDIWTSWEIVWTAMVLCFAGMTWLAVRKEMQLAGEAKG